MLLLCFFGRRQTLLCIGQFAILQFGCLLQVVFLHGCLNLLIDIIDLFTDDGNGFELFLLLFPLRHLAVEFFTLFREFFGQFRQTLTGQFIGLFLQRSLFDLHLHNFTGDLIEVCRHGVEFRLNHGTGFVHEVDRLIRQETVGNVTIGQCSCCYEGTVGDLYAVEYFIALFQATQDGDGILDRRLINQNGLETTLQCRILFDVLTVLIQSRSTDTTKFATR